MKKHLSKRRVIVAAVVAVALAITSGVAFAYWTSSGGGSGFATNESANGTLVLHASFAGGLTPGASQSVSFTAGNAGTSNLQVGTVTSVVSTSDPVGCKASWFSIAPVAEDQTIQAGQSDVALAHDGSITFNDSLTENQDLCKGALVTLTLSS